MPSISGAVCSLLPSERFGRTMTFASCYGWSCRPHDLAMETWYHPSMHELSGSRSARVLLRNFENGNPPPVGPAKSACVAPLSSPQGLNNIARMLADGTITARIRSTVELDGVGQMLEKLRHGGLCGKAVIRF
jgi:hypothetical protein